MKGKLDLQTRHTLPTIVRCAVPVWGLPGTRRMSARRKASASCQRSLAPHFAPTDTSVDCPEPAESHQGERPEIKADKSAPTCERRHVTNIQQCHIRPTPWWERRPRWIAESLLCIAAGYWMSRVIGQEHIHVTLAASHLIYPDSINDWESWENSENQ